MDVDVYVGLIKVDVVVVGARSLKDLRRPLVSLRDRLRVHYGLSVHQVGSAMRPARGALVGVTVGNDARALRSHMDKAAAFARGSSVAAVSASVDVFAWQEHGMIDDSWIADGPWRDDE